MRPSTRWQAEVPYELEFQANIQQATTYDRKGGSSEAIVEMLEKMLDDKKNEEYLDQVVTH